VQDDVDGAQVYIFDSVWMKQQEKLSKAKPNNLD